MAAGADADGDDGARIVEDDADARAQHEVVAPAETGRDEQNVPPVTQPAAGVEGSQGDRVWGAQMCATRRGNVYGPAGLGEVRRGRGTGD